mmetsp:Transcript_37921/g.59981  ORF Transcript_37921/g.59981 Transcript_37921/m.59981 type:complete len:83 (+) Transcript_37921:1399-1647(+)
MEFWTKSQEELILNCSVLMQTLSSPVVIEEGRGQRASQPPINTTTTTIKLNHFIVEEYRGEKEKKEKDKKKRRRRMRTRKSG